MIALLAGAALAGVVAAEAPGDLDEAWRPRRIALLVGIDDYDDPELGDLSFASKDAEDLEEALTTAGGFDAVTRLDGTVTAQEFWLAFDRYRTSLSRDDTFMVFIAAHGTVSFQDNSTRLFVMASDSQLARAPQTGISIDLLEKAIARLPARRRVLVLDTCHSGDGRSGLSDQTRDQILQFRGPIPPPSAASISQADVRLYSAHLNQPALEDRTLENGVYTHYFVRALSGEADLDGDGLIEVVEAHDWARDQTMQHTGGRQVPWMRAEVVGRDAIYLAGDEDTRAEREHAILSSLSALPAQARLSVDGVSRGAGQITTGTHHIRVEIDDAVVVDQTVRIRRTQALSLARLVDQREARWLLTAGATVRDDAEWMPRTLGTLSGWWLPPDPGQGRLAVGLSGQAGFGKVVGEGRFSAGTGAARVGWWWGDDLVIGPTLSGGVLWRLHPDEAQASPALSVGNSILLTGRRIGLSIDGQAMVFPASDGPQILPMLSVSGTIER